MAEVSIFPRIRLQQKALVIYTFSLNQKIIILENITIDGNKILFWLSFMDQSRDKKILN